MKKSALYLTVACLIGCPVLAEPTSEAGILEKALSDSFGAKVSVNMQADACRVQYPETAVQRLNLDSALDATASPFGMPTAPSGDSVKEESVTLPASEATCQKIEDFKSYTQYRITSSSADRFWAQLSNTLGAPMIKGLEIQSVQEVWDVVPQMNWTRAQNKHISGISFSKEDRSSGQKEQIATLKEVISTEDFIEEGNKITYKSEGGFNDLKVDVGLASAQIQSAQERSDITYTIPEQQTFDYHNMVSNLTYLASAQSSGLIRGITVDVPLFGAKINLDLGTKNKTEVTEQNTIETQGVTQLQNIVLSGVPVGKESIPQNVVIKYALQNVPAEVLPKLKELAEQEDTLSEDEQGLRVAQALDFVADKAKLVVNLDLHFPAGDILGTLALTRKDGYAQGIGTIKVTNLYSIIPDLKDCAQNHTCPQEDSMMLPIDPSKNDSETVYKFTDQGIFKDDVKIAPPIELNFEKMYKETKEGKSASAMGYQAAMTAHQANNAIDFVNRCYVYARSKGDGISAFSETECNTLMSEPYPEEVTRVVCSRKQGGETSCTINMVPDSETTAAVERKTNVKSKNGTFTFSPKHPNAVNGWVQ